MDLAVRRLCHRQVRAISLIEEASSLEIKGQVALLNSDVGDDHAFQLQERRTNRTNTFST
jgi:hypothetical protein